MQVKDDYFQKLNQVDLIFLIHVDIMKQEDTKYVMDL